MSYNNDDDHNNMYIGMGFFTLIVMYLAYTLDKVN